MNNLKTYKEFQPISESLVAGSTVAGLIIYGISHLITKFGSKFLQDKRNKDLFKGMIKDEMYTSGKWIINKTGDKIHLFKSKAVSFTLDKKNKTFTHNSDILPFTIKLKDSELKEIMDGIDFAEEVTESIDDCFYELKDDGYDVSLHRIDFMKKSFVVDIHKDNNISMEEISHSLDECLYKITNQYSVKVDKDYSRYLGLDFNEDRISDYDSGSITISTSHGGPVFVYDVNKTPDENTKYIIHTRCFGKLTRTLTIPFIKI